MVAYEREAHACAVDGKQPRTAGEFRAALDTLFSTLDEAQSWFVFCINPNDSQLPGQLEGRAVKGQIRSAGAKRNAVVFEANMTPAEFCSRYKDQLAALNVHEGDETAKAVQARRALDLQERDIVVGTYKVGLFASLTKNNIQLLTIMCRSSYLNELSISSKIDYG